MKYKGPVLLLITAILWGMAFVAQTVGGNSVGAFTFNASRNFIGVVFLTGVILWRKKTGVDQAPSEDGTGYCEAAATLAAANDQIAAMLREETDKLLDNVLLTAGNGMRNGFSRSDG